MDVVLCLTHDCQLRCRYCYAGRKRAAPMTWDVARAAVDLAFAEPDNPLTEVRKISFFGGEPLLEWTLLQQAVAYAREREPSSARPVEFTLTTNGLDLSKERLEFLARERFEVCFSFDGCREAQDAARLFADGSSSFEPTLAALRTALEYFPSLELVAVVSPPTVRHLPQSLALSDLGVRRIILNPDYYTHWNEADLAAWRTAYEAAGRHFLEEYRRGRGCHISFLVIKILTKIHGGYEGQHFCDYGGAYMAVAPSGRLYPCQRTVVDDTDDVMCLGDVHQGIRRDLQRHFVECRGRSSGACSECVLRPRCRNWCSCINYAVGGDIVETPAIVCFHERLAIEVADAVASTLYAEKNPLFLKTFYRDEAGWEDWR